MTEPPIALKVNGVYNVNCSLFLYKVDYWKKDMSDPESPNRLRVYFNNLNKIISH